MNAGFVINGKPEHGIVRATRFLAEALRHVGGTDVAVLETTEEAPDDDSFAKFQSTLPKDAVIVFQASHRTNYIWGPYETRIARIENILRKADTIYLEEIRNAGLYDAIWQAFAVILPVKTVGVMGDERSYDFVCALRAVTSTDGMTADVYPFTHEFLTRTATRIINEVRGINRVTYDITSKPPGTIEWE